jgi:hypothetical protein
MAAKIGILGESTALGTGEVTVYTVPGDKAARVRVQFVAEGPAANWRYAVRIGSPGSEVTWHADALSGEDQWSGSRGENTTDPTDSMPVKVNGIQQQSGVLLTDPDGGREYVASPFAVDYFLSDGDTVRFIITTNALVDHLIQVMGVEDDA